MTWGKSRNSTEVVSVGGTINYNNKLIINFIYIASILITVLGAWQYHEKCIKTTLTKKKKLKFRYRSSYVHYCSILARQFVTYWEDLKICNWEFRSSKNLPKVLIICMWAILGDPGAVSGGGKKSKRARKKFGRRKVKNVVLDFSSPEFISRPLRLFPTPANCPWVSEDACEQTFLKFGVKSVPIHKSIPMLSSNASPTCYFDICH